MKIIFQIDAENFNSKFWVVLKILQVINSPKNVGITENYLCFHRVRKAHRWSRAGYDVALFNRILSFSSRFRALSAGVHCTLQVAGWKPTSNHIKITVGFFNLHKGWLSLHRGHPVNIPNWRTMHLSSAIPANDTKESVFGLPNFPCRERGSNLGPLTSKK